MNSPEGLGRGLLALTWLPEFNVAVFAFLLNYPWEFLQVPLFERMAGAQHWDAIKMCTWATVGDALIMLLAYWLVAARARSRRWILAPTGSQLALFVTIGMAVTSLIEWFVLHDAWFRSWQYSAQMPVLPGVGIGLSPLLQWVALPPLVAWFVRRQLAAQVA